MSIAELQLDIIDRIINTQDTKVLEYISALLHDTVDADGESHWDTLPESERQRMIKAAVDIHNGKGEAISHEVVMEKYRKWL
ncbi:hypothetical protein [Neolewinella sp.]|uniref:hypothetical protein n=1 Tax=Neolewinella sp. TaxID=2993543 RepID=UPI003B527CFC